MLKQLTEQLLIETKVCHDRLFKMREEDREPDFFAEVKPYADDLHEKLKRWRELSFIYITKNKPKYVHQMQIENCIESFEQVIVQSFYQKTSKKRFLDSIRSIQYTFETFLRALSEGGVTCEN